MAKELSQQIKDLVKKITKELEQTVKSKAFYDEVGEEVSTQIRKRTRLGYGISGTESQVKLKPTAPSTKKGKEFKKKKGKLSGLTTPKKSNLTDTGQLLDSINHKASIQKVVIGFKDQRKDSEIGNKELAKHVQVDRPFFGLTTPEKNRLKRLIEKKIQEMVKRLK